MNKKIKKYYFFVGTTAEYIKLAPVIREFNKQKVKFSIITSGQTKVAFNDFAKYTNIKKSNINLVKKSKKKSSVLFFGFWAVKSLFLGLRAFKLELENKDKENVILIVHGDTVSSVIGSIIAKFHRVKLAHVESGLRSFNFFEPFPEEMSRFIISKLADIHFCQNEWSMNNLKKTTGEKVNTKQNTLIESYDWSKTQKGTFNIKNKTKRKYFILVVHRQEHVLFKKKKAQNLVRFVTDNASKELDCVFIKHAISIQFIKLLKNSGDIKRKLVLVPRLPYVDFMKLIEGAEFIATDGGSNQEEVYYMGKPCLILRNSTERIEGLKKNAILSKENGEVMKKFMNEYKKYKQKPIKYKIAPSKIIVDFLKKYE